jgi:PAS domain S-box-containing protein
VHTEIRLAQLAAVVEQSTEFIGVADQEGRPVYLNEAGLKMMGLPSLEAACSHHLLDYFAEHDRDIIREEALQTCDIEGYWEKELSFRRFDDGSEFPVLYNIFPVRTPAGETTTGYATVTRDLTEKKRIEKELRALNLELAARVEEAVEGREAALAQLHELKKLETIGQLTGGVAHDFNNLLTPIVGALDVVSRKPNNDERTRRLVLGALQAADRARTLIQRLLAFARRQHLEARAVDVSALVVGMMDLVRRSIGPQVRLTIDCPSSLPHALVDPNQLELAILNLAVNAKDAMASGGELEISVSLEDGTGVQSLGSGPYIRIDVRDSGAGMDEATLARAVEPFFTTKGLGRGTGLGLSSVHGLAAQSGGRFVLSSCIGVGTTATLWLPVTDEVAVLRQPSENVPVLRSGNNRTILLVDDEQLVRSATADMLVEAGFQVEQAESGFAAIQMIEKGLHFDALVTDHAMPGLTGAELARRVRLSRPNVPILIVTGYANLSDADAGSFPRLAKPFAQSEFTALCVELLEKPQSEAL